MAREDTQFKEGNSGNGGRPKGSRNKLSTAFLSALADDFEVHGVATISEIRETRPDVYLNIIGRLMPKLMELSGTDTDDVPLDDRVWTINIVRPDKLN